jgi:hypothetical protein
LKLKLDKIIYKNSIRTAKKAHFSGRDVSWLTLFKEIIGVCSQNPNKTRKYILGGGGGRIQSNPERLSGARICLDFKITAVFQQNYGVIIFSSILLIPVFTRPEAPMAPPLLMVLQFRVPFFCLFQIFGSGCYVIGCSIPGRDKGYFFAGPGAHPASCTMGTGGSFPGGKARPGRDADRSPPSSAEVKKE